MSCKVRGNITSDELYSYNDEIIFVVETFTQNNTRLTEEIVQQVYVRLLENLHKLRHSWIQAHIQKVVTEVYTEYKKEIEQERAFRNHVFKLIHGDGCERRQCHKLFYQDGPLPEART